MVLVSRRARCVTSQMTVVITLMKSHVVAIWHVATLKATCVHGNNKLMMNSTGPEGRVKHPQLLLVPPEIIPWVPQQVGIKVREQFQIFIL